MRAFLRLLLSVLPHALVILCGLAATGAWLAGHQEAVDHWRRAFELALLGAIYARGASR